jgi:RNA polymerase sigma-70 factor (ECF subfamily)
MQIQLEPERERQLIERAKDDPEAFRELYRHYLPRVYAYVAYRVGKKQEAEDLVSELFLKVVERISEFQYRGTGTFPAWLFQIARNQVNAFFRQNNRDSNPVPLEDLPDVGESPGEAVLRKERFAELREMIGTLSPRRRETILLKYFGGLRNQEIARVLSLDERTVASHISRGLADLQLRMVENSQDEEIDENEFTKQG